MVRGTQLFQAKNNAVVWRQYAFMMYAYLNPALALLPALGLVLAYVYAYAYVYMCMYACTDREAVP